MTSTSADPSEDLPPSAPDPSPAPGSATAGDVATAAGGRAEPPAGTARRRRVPVGRLVAAAVTVLVVAGAVVAVVRMTADEPAGGGGPVVVVDAVGRADLRDVVVVRGQAERGERFTVTALSSPRVTGLTVAAEAVVTAGDELLRLDGRPMLAVTGDIPYWRPLQRGVNDGPDVELLKRFLTDAGYAPGPVDTDATEATFDALEAWQTDHGYPVDGVFLPTDVVVQQWPATAGRVEVMVGDVVAPGQVLARFVDAELTVTLDIDPTDRSRLDVGLPATVTVAATELEAPGTVTGLDDAPTPDAQGGERYGGQVAIEGHLDVVDGSAVRVEVVLVEVLDALVVPVASVSLDGSGQEEVRVLTAQGTLRRVPVRTGLTEGAFVEIVEGLDGSEQVVVEVRQ